MKDPLSYDRVEIFAASESAGRGGEEEEVEVSQFSIVLDRAGPPGTDEDASFY